MSDNRAAANAKLTRVDKAAILLLSLGETDAAQVLRHMGPKEVQRVGVAMAQMRNVHREQVEQVMSEFVEIVGAYRAAHYVYLELWPGHFSDRARLGRRPGARPAHGRGGLYRQALFSRRGHGPCQGGAAPSGPERGAGAALHLRGT